MHVFGEPVGRQVVAGAVFFGLAVQERTGGGELVAEADIVDEAGDLVRRAAAGGAAGDQLGQRRHLFERDVFGDLPAATVGTFGHHQILGEDVDRPCVAAVDDDAVGAFDGGALDFRPLDRA